MSNSVKEIISACNSMSGMLNTIKYCAKLASTINDQEHTDLLNELSELTKEAEHVVEKAKDFARR